MNNIIYIQKPKTYLEKHRGDLLFLVPLYFILALITWDFILPFYAVCFLAAIYFVPNLFYTQYDGWNLNSNQITIESIPVFKPKVSVVIPLKSIYRITYHEGYKRTPNSIEIESNMGKHRLFLNISMFQIAPTLLYLKQQGIKLELNKRDAELELYLDEKVESIPIQNKY